MKPSSKLREGTSGFSEFMRTAVSLGVEPVELDVRRAWVGVPLMKKVEVAIEGRDKKQLVTSEIAQLPC